MRALELHMALSIVQRSQGRSSVAAAAYIAGQKLTDERTGLVHDYTRKQGVVLTGIALSEQAPAWALDRQRLWSSAEMREAHARAQTARSMTVNLPHEFLAEHRQEASTKIAHLLADRYRGAVDWALHEPSDEGDHRNHHSHFLMTARPFENGAWAAKKDRTLDDRYGQGPIEYRALREKISGVINDIAVREGLPVYVEHLSFKDRQLEQEPTQHLGPGAMGKERRGERTERGDENRAIRARNEERESLRVQSNVIDIEAARELQKRRRGAPLPRNWQAAYTDLYRESYNKRAAMLEHLERENGERERNSRQEAARLQHAIDNANLIQRAWRYVSGRTRQDRHQIEQAKLTLQEIAIRKEQAVAKFEQERILRFEAFHRERALHEQRIREELAIAVGAETARQSLRRSPAPTAVPTVPAIQPKGVGVSEPALSAPPHSQKPDYLARRDEFFERIARKRQDAANVPANASDGPETTPLPTQAQGPKTKPKPDYEARRDEFFTKIRKRSRPKEVLHAPGQSPAPPLPDYDARRENLLARRRVFPAAPQEVPKQEPVPSPPPALSPVPAPKVRPSYESRRDALLARQRKERDIEAPKPQAGKMVNQRPLEEEAAARRPAEEKRTRPQTQGPGGDPAPADSDAEIRRAKFMGRRRKGRSPSLAEPELEEDRGPSLER